MTARVLLVDDVATERRLVRAALERSGHFCVVGEGADGEEGVALAMELHPDVVLMDLSMPRMDGLEALTRLQARCPGLPVVILSGLSAHDAAASALRLGAAGYLEKGLHPTELVAYLDRLTGATAGAGSDGPAGSGPPAAQPTPGRPRRRRRV
jgi:DNA-binding NarL/FixJ family response regulator